MGIEILGYKKLPKGEKAIFGTFKKKKKKRDKDSYNNISGDDRANYVEESDLF